MTSSTPSRTPTLIFLGLPQKTFIGIDLLTFSSSPQFQGISRIPPGFHLLYTGTDASLSIRHGHWFCISPSTVGHTAQPLIWQWNTEEETVSLLPNEEGTVPSPTATSGGLIDYRALQNATTDIKVKRVGPTDPDSHSRNEETLPSWSSLTSQISAPLLDRILSKGTNTRTVQTWAMTSLTSTTADLEATARQIPGLNSFEALPTLASAAGEAALNLLPIDLSRTFPSDSTGAVRTAAARDRSWYLSHLIDSIDPSADPSNLSTRSTNAAHLLGELQLTFLSLLTLSNYSALEGWKRLLEVLLTCSSSLVEIPKFFTLAIHTLHQQVSMFDEIDGGLFELSELAGGGMWLRKLLRRFRGAFEDVRGAMPADGGGLNGLGEELGKLEATMRDRYGWDDVGASVLRRGRVQLEDGEEVEVQLDGVDEEEETGEWAPVVVDL